jgi:hypothetical protein
VFRGEDDFGADVFVVRQSGMNGSPPRETPRRARQITRHTAAPRNLMRETGLSTEAWFLLRRPLGACVRVRARSSC